MCAVHSLSLRSWILIQLGASTLLRIRELSALSFTILHGYQFPSLEQLSGSLGRQSVADVGEPSHGIIGSDRLDCYLHGVPERLFGASAQSAQDGLELGEGL